METPEVLVTVLIGIGLAAACGFRVFVPFLILSIAATSGHLSLSSGFEWIGTTPALIAFAIATVVEIAAYYIPWLDNVLDAAATPAAVVAGTIVTAAAIQSATVAVRGVSTASTGGIANPVVSTGEAVGSTVTGILAIVLPAAAVVLVAVMLLVLWRIVARLRRRRREGARRADRSAC